MNALTILGFAATIVFGLLSVFLYFRGRRYKGLSFNFQTTELQTRAHPEVKIIFKDREVENLSRLRAVIWNSGTEEIRWSDVPQSGPPVSVFKNARILSISILGANEDTKLRAEQRDQNSLRFEFAYFNPGEWGLIEVLYEGTSTDGVTIDTTARIIGGRPTDSRAYEDLVKGRDWLSPPLFLLAAFMSALGFFAERHRGLWGVFRNGFRFSMQTRWSYVILDVFSLLVFLLIAVYSPYWLVKLGKQYRRSRLPKAARDFLLGAWNPDLQSTSPSASSASQVGS